MFSSFAFIAFSKALTLWWAALGSIKVSVEAHQIVISRLAPLDFLKSRMSWRSCSAKSNLFFPFFTFGPSIFFT